MARSLYTRGSFMWMHENTAYFEAFFRALNLNPDYNPAAVARYKRYSTELRNYEQSLPDSMPDDEYNTLLRTKQRELQKKYDIYVRLGALRDEEFSTLSYSIQCTDAKSGTVGNFVHAGDFQALSPVFPDLPAFITWLGHEGVKLGALGSFKLEKTTVC